MSAGIDSLITDRDINILRSKCLLVRDYHTIDGIHSPLNPSCWAELLFNEEVPDEDSLFILDGVYNGFRVVDLATTIPIYDCENYKSCYADYNYNKMNNVLLSELSSGKISYAKSKPLQIHALGAVPKPNGSVRHITDCSMPAKKSVNNFMKDTFSKFSFNTLDDIITKVKPGSFMATIDLQEAYRSVPIHPENRKHFGLNWDFGNGSTYLTDNFLCFGSKCSAFIFNRLTDSVARFMGKHGFCCYNYLDDFIVIGSSYEETCHAQRFLIATLRKLGFYISWRKITSPTQYCRFLGIDIDSVNQRLLLPPDKNSKFHKELDFWSGKKYATKLQMQRLCGTLNYCCKVIRGGRVYMFHMIQLLKLFKDARRITLPKAFHDDIKWWSTFATLFNGYADFFNPVTNTMEIVSDACLDGLAAICDGDFYQAKVLPCDDAAIHYEIISTHAYQVYVPKEHAANINVLELIAILLALLRWEHKLQNCRVIAYCDNLQVCYNLAKDKTINALSIECLRNVFWLCVRNNIYISPVYIPSIYNIDADYLSRSIYF